jgi:DNA ligase-1
MGHTDETISYTKTIYKTDSADRLRFVTVTAQGNMVCQESGLFDGKATQHWSVSKAKNIGKKNETTPEWQAILDAKAKINKKLKAEYFETQGEAIETAYVSPMLAYSSDLYIDEITYTEGEVFVQPKLDGMRCIKDKGSMKSRKNRDIETLPDIAALLPESNIVLDGELYSHGASFQEVMKMVKKVGPETHKIKYHVYDTISDKPFVVRFGELLELVKEMGPNSPIRIVPTFPVSSREEIDMCHAKFLEAGYEGTMIRWGNESYEIDKRSKHLLKHKDFKDMACTIVDVVPSEKRPDLGVVHCRLNEKKWLHKSGTGTILRVSDTEMEVKNGEVVFDYPEFGCGMKFSHEEREDILANKYEYIGQTAEIRYFEETDDGIPRFPVCVGFRLDK